MPSVTYPPEVVDRLQDALDRMQGPWPHPTKEQLVEILGIAWAATLMEEEGRRTRFTLACADPRLIRERGAERGWGTASPFAEPLPCEPGRIAKLAPAANPNETLLGVRWREDGPPEIWGLVHLDSVDYDAAPFVRITGFRPGGFVVAAMMQRILMYVGGVARWYDHDSGAISTLLRQAPLLGQTEKYLDVQQGTVARELENLAERVVLAGHGGTILISGPLDPTAERTAPAGIRIPPTSTFAEPDGTLTKAVRQDCGNAPPTNLDKVEARRVHEAALDHVARLANVDGAVVMGLDLRVYGFGATIERDPVKAPDTMQLVIYQPTQALTLRPELVATIAETPGGHRHKSAVHFCAMQVAGLRTRHGSLDETAIAFVASQDGSLSLCGAGMNHVDLLRPFLLRGRRLR